MADVDVLHTVTTHESSKKTRKVKKTTKRRESADQGSEITITEIDQTITETDGKDEGYVIELNSGDDSQRIVFLNFHYFQIVFSFVIFIFTLFGKSKVNSEINMNEDVQFQNLKLRHMLDLNLNSLFSISSNVS